MQKENKVSQSGKQKIKLTGNYHCKCNAKVQIFEAKQQSLVESLLRQPKQQYKGNHRAARISIDLDKIRSEQKNNQVKNNLNIYKAPICKKARTLLDKISLSESIVVQSRTISQQNQNKNIQNAENSNRQSISRLPITPRLISKRKSSSKCIRESVMKKNINRNKSMQMIQRNIYQCYQQLTTNSSPSKEIGVKAASVDILLKELFRKLTKKNLPYEQWINYLNLSYSELTTEQLRFVGLLLERVEPHYLSSMDYLTFKFKAYQKCRKDLQELVALQQTS